jgi:queuine tRNA-ribosyltransferase
MGWSGPILTDSGGFQVFSLEGLRRVDEDGVDFQSHIDGSRRRFTPEVVMRIERNLGADVVMQFDHVIPGDADAAAARDASDRSIRWLERCRVEFDRLEGEPGTGNREPQALFPVIQGGIHAELRRDAARTIRGMSDWLGYGIGGLSVGESKPNMYAMLEVLDGEIPRDRPRYLMGVGFPEDLIEAIARGVDLFDCVAPTRMGRNGTVFTSEGRINVKRSELRFSRAYLRHLFVSNEVLGLRLLSLHNVHFLISLVREARGMIQSGSLDPWAREWIDRLRRAPAPT